MNKALLFLGLVTAMNFAHATDIPTGTATVKYVQSATFEDSDTLKVTYRTGGCGESINNPKIHLEHIETIDTTPQWAIDQDPETERQYLVRMQAVVTEATSWCRMGYSVSTSASLKEIFKEAAPKLGIDLTNKKDYYDVQVVAPQVISASSFSAIDRD
jgi:hypothetical protein